MVVYARGYTLSPKSPRITARQVVQALRRVGWYQHHQEGAHVFLRHPDRPGMRVTVAMHAGETIKPRTLKSILEQAGLTVDDFIELL
jgi:predicted RNA binding protein YcfA (HicA-like mRNA interferase family)